MGKATMQFLYVLMLVVALVGAMEPEREHDSEYDLEPENSQEQEQEHEQSRESRAQIYCGRRLAAAQAAFCEGFDISSTANPTNYPVVDTTGQAWPWLARRYGQMLAATARQERIAGLVDECCHKPCRISDLLSYC